MANRSRTGDSGGVGFGDDLVLVASRKGDVVALDKSKGQQLWRAQVASEVLAPPAADAGVVVVQSVDGKLTGLESATGKRLWTLDLSEPALSLRGTATPVILSDAVLTGFASGKIVAVNLKNGRLLWETPVASHKDAARSKASSMWMSRYWFPAAHCWPPPIRARSWP